MEENGEYINVIDQELEEFRRHGNSRLSSERPVVKFVKVSSDDIYRELYAIYKPCKISLGPYWEKEENPIKRQCVVRFLGRLPNKPTYKECIQVMSMEMESLMEAYQDISDLSHHEFVAMMIHDGCCLLEIMMGSARARARARARDSSMDSSSLFSERDMEAYKYDMLRLGNQIPLRVLHRLFSLTCPPNTSDEDITQKLNNLIVDFFFLPRVRPTPKSLHILDVYRMGVLNIQQYEEFSILIPNDESMLCLPFNIPSATELDKAQIGITNNKTPIPIDISFNGKTLKLPQIMYDDNFKAISLSIVLYEKYYPELVKNEYSSYIYFMQALLKSAPDSNLMQARGIITTTLGDEDVVRWFRKLCKYITFTEFNPMKPKFLKEGQLLRKKYNKVIQPWRKDLLQTYLRSPWAIISVLAAILIFTLSVIQTVYTVLSYVNRN